MDTQDRTDGRRWTLAPGDPQDLPAVRRVVISLGRGRIDVLGRDEPGARVEAHEVGGLPVAARLDDGVLRIGDPDPSPAERAALVVAVQRSATVEIVSVSAEVLVSGMKEGLAVSTVSGDVLCDATAGRARLETTSGELALREHEGPVDASTVSGAVTASGPIPRFECDGVSGDVFLDLEAPDRVRLRSVSGAVVLRLGTERAAEYAIGTVSGGVVVDGREVGRAPGGYRGGWGAPGGDPTRVQVETASGTVRIVHPGAA